MDVAARVIAWEIQRAVVTQERAKISPDPDPVFGIAPIRIVSEQQVQAIAFGLIGAQPQTVTRWNPLSRESGDLEPFAFALDRYLNDMLAAGKLPRVWLPHKAALELIEILGYRYRTNKMASTALQQMGSQCLALAEEERVPGQQVVVVAAELLREHIVTAQSPKEDHHLGALLAWIDPPTGVNVEHEAARRALIPAAAMLERHVDDRVERLRKLGKKRGRAAESARQEIKALQMAGALQEWALLVEARKVFWDLALLQNSELGPLVDSSVQRVSYSLEQARSPRSRPPALARLLDELEEAADLAEDAEIRGDAIDRERARRQGRVFFAEVINRDQPRANCHPCRIELLTHQQVLRIRRDTKLRTLDGRLVGVVSRIVDDVSGGTRIELKITKGVKGQANRDRMTRGFAEDWCDSVTEDRSYYTMLVHRAVRDAQSPLVFGESLPPPKPRRIAHTDLVALAEGLRRP